MQERFYSLNRKGVKMKLTGPCYVAVHLGKPCGKWQVNRSFVRNHRITTESYYFNTQEEAETYFLYFQQQIAREDLEKTIKSKKTYQWERKELLEFKKTLDFSVLENKIKDITFTKETNYCETRRRK